MDQTGLITGSDQTVWAAHSCNSLLTQFILFQGWKIEPLTVSLTLTLILVSVQFILTLVWRIMRASAILRASTLGSEQTICQPCSALWIEGNLPSGCEEEKDSENSGRCCCDAGLVIDTLVKKVILYKRSKVLQ